MTDKRCDETQELQRAARAEEMVEYTVSDQVVLAGQPQPEDWAKLAERGFKAVLNIRHDPEKAAAQAKKARAAGLHYFHLPLPAYELEPEDMAAFNEVIRQSGQDKLLIHCRTASRTALLWILNRIVYDGWSQAEAEAELYAAGYDEEAMDTFRFCTEDYFERTATSELKLHLSSL